MRIIRFAFILFCVNLVAALVLAVVYSRTYPRILEQQRLKEEETLKEVMPETVADRIEPAVRDNAIIYWKAYKGANPEPVGYIFIAKKYGYSSTIESMVGIKRDGTITGVRVISHSETPGLGARIAEVISERTIFIALKELFFRKSYDRKEASPYFTEQFKGKKIDEIDLSSADIHAITGATISSNAVVDSIKLKAMQILNSNE